MSQILLTTFAFAIFPISVFACPAPRDFSKEETELLNQAQAATSNAQGQEITRELWRLWATAPDDVAQELLDTGMAARASYDFARAIESFDRLTEYCPDYAEGYNQRAFVNFLREDYAAALLDLDLALARSPQHVAAMSGKALTLMGLGRNDEAQIILQDAVNLNPWISERSLLLSPRGTDL